MELKQRNNDLGGIVLVTQYLILNNFDIEKLVCEENVRVKTEKCDIVICTEEYYANVILDKNLNIVEVNMNDENNCGKCLCLTCRYIGCGHCIDSCQSASEDKIVTDCQWYITED